jgi:hypothetical protein
MERRCIAVHNMMADMGCLENASILDIEPHPSRYAARVRTLKADNQADLAVGSFPVSYFPTTLLAPDAEIVSLVERITASGPSNLLCDISCMPKRFFFPFVKLLLRNSQIKNLVMTYAVPEGYYDDRLAEDHGPLQSLPLFGPTTFDDQFELAIVAVGFVPLGVASLIEPYKDKSMPVELLFPFPPGPPSYQRNWKFIEEIRYTLADSGSDPHRLPAVDMSGAFDYIAARCANGEKRAAFAPYGPKPISLAMCIYAALNGCPAYYTQPKVYHPEYSTGIAQHGGHANINAYAIRLHGYEFYT